MSYKGDIADERESPAIEIMRLLEEAGVDLAVYDPYIPSKSTVKSIDEALDHADSILIATSHSEFRKLRAKTLSDRGVKIVVDGRNVLRDIKEELKEASIKYVGIGV